MLYMSISGFFANAACGPKAHSDTAPEFRLWLNDCLKPLGDNKILQTVDRVFSQKEKNPMFAASVEEYKAKLFEEGRQEGISEGIRKGKLEGKLEGRQEGRQEGISEGVRKGKLEGKLEGIREIARKLKQSGIALEIISKNTGLSLDEIEAL